LEDPAGFRERLGKVTYANLIATLEKALAKTGNTIADLDYYIVLHMNPNSHRILLDMLGLPLEKACYHSTIGHVGQLDPLIGMALAEQEGKIKKGDLVGLNIMGIGYTWAGGAIRW
jgi:3-oxoacyl-[acyl-carrier-protein] synthase-3